MKLSHIVKLSLFLSCALFYAQPNLPMWPRTAQTPEEQHEGLRKIADRLNQVTLDVLINCMHTLETNLAYWRKMLSHPGYHKFLRGPQGWFDSKNSTTLINGYIKELEALEKQHAEALGSLYNDLQEKEDIHWQVYVNNSFKRAPLPCSVDTAPTTEELPTTYIEKCTALLRKIAKVRSYKTAFEQAIEPYRQPSHLGRHWWKYAIGGAAAATAGGFFYKNPDVPELWYNNFSSFVKTEWQDRVATPINKFKKEYLAHGQKSQNADATAPEENKVQDMKNALNAHVRDFANKRAMAQSAKAAPLVQSDHQIFVDQAVENSKKTLNGNFAFLMQCLDEESRDIVKKILHDAKPWNSEETFQLMRVLNLIAQSGLVQAAEAQEKVERLAKLQEVNLAIAGMFPIALVAYGTYKTSNAVFNRVFSKKGIYIPLQNRVALMIAMLNRLQGSSTMNLEAHGKLLYHLSVAEKFTALIPEGAQEVFTEHISMLKKYDKTIPVQNKITAAEQIQKLVDRLNI